MFSRQLPPIHIDQHMLDKVIPYSVKDGWTSNDTVVSSFKSKLRELLSANQDNKCAYCELSLSTRGPEIEHIAHKAKYYTVSFNPDNLVLACHSCNGTSHKGRKDVVVNSSDKLYSNWSLYKRFPR